MSMTFYRAFEDRHRGSRELISKRLEVYLPFVEPLKSLYPECPVMDLGCGRGEWLELLQEHGFLARGVDLDHGMLEACRVLRLSAEYGDALSALAALEDSSQTIVSAFHLVEHIPFTDVQKLVSEAVRVLKPAGLLIMETPNAENLVVGTSSFFLDPTHEKPVPLDLLGFLTEYSGFLRTKVIRLQEDASLRDSEQQLTLMDVLGGASPDYAIVAQKAADPAQLAVFDGCFERGYGVSLESLAQRYEHQSQLRSTHALAELNLPALHEQLIDIRAELRQLREQAAATKQAQHLREQEELKAQFQQLRQEDELKAQVQQLRLQDELKAQVQQLRLQEEIKAQFEHLRAERDAALEKANMFWLESCAKDSAVHALTSSTSWRITAPLRWSVSSVRGTPNRLKSAPRRALSAGFRFLLARPALLQKLNGSLKRAPRLHNLLKSVVHNHGMMGETVSLAQDGSVPLHLDGLSVEARQVYNDLQKAINQKDLS